jgi:DNA-binding MarR family transcriptional regulator
VSALNNRKQKDLDELSRTIDVPSERRTMSTARVRKVINERKRRAEFLRRELFSDPAWDLLLEAYVLKLSGKDFAVGKAGKISSVPPSTALRWVKVLECEGLLIRRIDPNDATRVLIELSRKGAQAMYGYFGAEKDNPAAA